MSHNAICLETDWIEIKVQKIELKPNFMVTIENKAEYFKKIPH